MESKKPERAMQKYVLTIAMVEVRNEAGRKVAVEPLRIGVEARTAPEAVAALASAMGRAILLGARLVQDDRNHAVQAKLQEEQARLEGAKRLQDASAAFDPMSAPERSSLLGPDGVAK